MKKRVIIVGGGFGGLAAAKALSRSKSLEILLIDRRNFHLFQPLLYQVAMAGLNPSDISVPLRTLFRHKKNVQVLLAEVHKIDCENKMIFFDEHCEKFDYLILSCGVKHSYFGQNQWEECAPGLKNIEQATEIRRKILTSFELAEKAKDPEAQKKYLTFVVVGGGPTGVELAGAIMEMTTHTFRRDFHNVDICKARVILVEAGPRVLPSFPELLSQKAQQALQQLGVEIRTMTRASELSAEGLKVGEQFIASRTILWAAGVRAASITDQLPGSKDSQGKILVQADLSLPGFSDVFVIGDQAACKTSGGQTLPGIAPVAIQQGHYVASLIQKDRAGTSRVDFIYNDKGIMATIGRSKAVAQMYGYNFSGVVAWLAWVLIHIVYLLRFKNRFFVLLQWAWAYFTFGRAARLITYKTWRFYSGEKIKIE